MRKAGERTFTVMKQSKHFCNRGKHISVEGKEPGDIEGEREFKGLGLQL